MNTQHLVIVDASLPDLSILLANVPDTTKVHFIHEHTDALDQIADAANLYQYLQGLHILGHGQPGRMLLGGQWVDGVSIEHNQQAMNTIARALAAEAHIWLYGCHSAQGKVGEQWLDAWALATGANLHASGQTVGREHADSYWDLEMACGLSPSATLQLSNPLAIVLQAGGWSHALAANTAPTFTTGTGKLSVPVGTGIDWGESIIQQDDGKLVVAGSSGDSGGSYRSFDFSLIRLNADGSLDTTFDADGKLIVPVGSDEDRGYSVIQQADGKLVVAGRSVNGGDPNFSLIRLNGDGSLDTSFDGDGKLMVPLGGWSSGNSVIQQADGKLVVAGNCTNGSNHDFGLIRLNIDGSFDNAFDNDGKVIMPVGTSDDIGYSVIQQADGKLVVAGYSYGGVNQDFSLIRLNADGSLDTSFGNGGKLLMPVGSDSDIAQSVIQQSDGKLVVAGLSVNGYAWNFSLIRLNVDGSLDTSFDGDGKLIVPMSTLPDRPRSVIQQADGKLVVAGSGMGGFGLIRINPDGSLDTSFGVDGQLIEATTDERGIRVIQQADGKLAGAGTSWNVSNAESYAGYGGSWDFSLIRLNADGSLDTSFGPTGNTLSSKPPNFTENSSHIVLASEAHVIDPELKGLNSGAGNYNGATIGLSRKGGANGDDVFIAAPGSGLTALTSGAYFAVGSVTIGRVTTNANGVLSLAFNSNATQSLVDKALQQIAYANTSDAPPAQVLIDWTFNDGNTGAQGTGGAMSVTGTTTVNITATNDAPRSAYTLPDSTVQPSVAFNLPLPTGAFTDPDGDALSYSIAMTSGTAVPPWLKLNTSTGTLSGTPDALDVGVFNLRITAKDGSNATASDDFVLTVQSNRAPTLTGLPTSIQSITAGTSAALAEFTVADADNNNLTVTLTPSNGTLGGLTDANPSLAGIQLTGTAASINTALAGATFTATSAGAASIAISVTDGVLTTPTTGTYSFTATAANRAPTLSSLPTVAQSITAGTAAALVDFTVADADNNNLTVTLSPTNGTLGGLTDANPSLAGFQLIGTAGSINTAIAGATFTATSTGAASIVISVSDGVVTTPTTGTYSFTAATGNLNLSGTANNDNLTGGPGNDTLNGLGGNDKLNGLEGNDTLNGDDGMDIALYAGAKASHTITRTGSAFTVSSTSEGTDTLTGIERLAFSDVKMAFDMDGSAGTTAMMMGALLGKTSLQNKALVGTVLGLTDAGQTLADLSQLVVSNGIVSSLAGGARNDSFVRLILRNVLGSDSNGELVTSLTTLLDSGVFTQSSLLATAAGLDLNKAQIDLVGLGQTGLEYI